MGCEITKNMVVSKWESSPESLEKHFIPVVPNRGAIYSAQGCRGLTRFFTISLRINIQAIIKPQSKLLWVRHYGCRKLLFFSVGCRKPKKVGKHCFIPFEKSKTSSKQKFSKQHFFQTLSSICKKFVLYKKSHWRCSVYAAL